MEEKNQETKQVVQPQQTIEDRASVFTVSHLKKHPIYATKYILIFLLFFALALIWGSALLLPSNKKSITKVKQAGSDSSLHTNNTAKQHTVTGNITAQTQVQSPSGSPLNTTVLPLGDNKYTTSGPKKGYIYLCNVGQGGGGAQENGSWIHGTTWNLQEKISVQGKVSWSNAFFSTTLSGSNRIISGNDLPYKTIAGIFPIQSSDPAYNIDRNPNSITAHNFTLTLPESPTLLATPQCIGGEVGVMTNGVPLFNGFDAEHRDAPAHEVQDSCDGHPQESGEYHYHSLSRCMTDIHNTTVLGFALDGFPITGPLLPTGNYLTTNDLDECHGMTSQVVLNGKTVTTYHYVMTEDFPYSVSCFRAKPVQMQVIAGLTGGKQNNAQQQQGNVQPNSQQQPPQAAFTSCSGKQTGAACSFSAPNGTVSGTCQVPPNQTQTLCVPNNRPQ